MQSGLPSKKQMRRELAILNTPTYVEERERFVRYMQQLQEAQTANVPTSSTMRVCPAIDVIRLEVG
jgi:hypothetical protein